MTNYNLELEYPINTLTRRDLARKAGFTGAGILLMACGQTSRPPLLTPTPSQRLTVEVNIIPINPADPSAREGTYKFPEGFFLKSPHYGDNAINQGLDFRLELIAKRAGTALELDASIGRLSQSTYIEGWGARLNPIDFTRAHVLQMRWSNYRFTYRAFDGRSFGPTPLLSLLPPR